jgi:hypothetical protein
MVTKQMMRGIRMATAKLVPSYERFLDRVVESMTPEEILAFRVSDEEQERVEDLLERNNEGELTPQEAAELHQIAQFDELRPCSKCGQPTSCASHDPCLQSSPRAGAPARETTL